MTSEAGWISPALARARRAARIWERRARELEAQLAAVTAERDDLLARIAATDALLVEVERGLSKTEERCGEIARSVHQSALARKSAAAQIVDWAEQNAPVSDRVVALAQIEAILRGAPEDDLRG